MLTSVNFCNFVGKLAQNITIELQKREVLSVTNLDYIGSLHTLDDCKKYIESTVRIVTDVKPVIFTVIIFAVYAFHGAVE